MYLLLNQGNISYVNLVVRIFSSARLLHVLKQVTYVYKALLVESCIEEEAMSLPVCYHYFCTCFRPCCCCLSPNHVFCYCFKVVSLVQILA